MDSDMERDLYNRRDNGQDNYLSRLKKENRELHQANASKFVQLEALKKQVNDLQQERDELAARNIHITNILDSDKFRRAKWIYTGTDSCFKDPDSLKETQAAAQRILDKDK